jgi:hypothetical protein
VLNHPLRLCKKISYPSSLPSKKIFVPLSAFLPSWQPFICACAKNRKTFTKPCKNANYFTPHKISLIHFYTITNSKIFPKLFWQFSIPKCIKAQSIKIKTITLLKASCVLFNHTTSPKPHVICLLVFVQKL